MFGIDQLRALFGLPGVNEKVLTEMILEEAKKQVVENPFKIGTLEQSIEAQKLMQAQAIAQQKVLAAQAQAMQNAYPHDHNASALAAIGGYIGSGTAQSPYHKPPSILFSEYEAEIEKAFGLPKHYTEAPKTIEALNTVDELEENVKKAKNALAKEVAKMTKPVKKIIEPVFDPEPSLEFMLVRQAKEKMLAVRKDWSVDQQNQVSVLNTQLTRVQAWNIVWTAVSEMPSDAQMEAWLIKRVFQVCDNVLDPSLTAHQVDSILNPKPELMAKPALLPPVNPFDREFS